MKPIPFSLKQQRVKYQKECQAAGCSVKMDDEGRGLKNFVVVSTQPGKEPVVFGAMLCQKHFKEAEIEFLTTDTVVPTVISPPPPPSRNKLIVPESIF
jgi:hypothetical protein